MTWMEEEEERQYKYYIQAMKLPLWANLHKKYKVATAITYMCQKDVMRIMQKRKIV